MKKITELLSGKIIQSLSTTQDDLYNDQIEQINHTLLKLKNLFHRSAAK